MRKALMMLLLTLVVGGTAATAQYKHGHDAAIELDNGQKWRVDANMLGYVNDMEKDIAAFNGKTLQEYQALATNLKRNVDQLTANCTMKGRAHDELHKWLLPYIETVNKLAKAKTEKNAAETCQQLVGSFPEFHRYFE